MKKILVIEDHDDIRENLAEILELAGYETFVAENGKIGVEMADKAQPDLILCDVMMPVLDGFGALSMIRKRPKLADVPFIFLTAKAEKGDFRYGMNLGADDYITKPFESNELLTVIEMRLKRAEKLQQAAAQPQGFSHFVNEARAFEALKNLAQERETRTIGRKNAVYTEGAAPRYLYHILKGKVKVFKTNDDGKELIINILGEGELFGHADLLRGGNYAESAAALEDSEVALIPKDDFFTLLNANRDVSAQFIKLLAGNVAAKEEQLLSLAYNSVRKRVADALLTLHNRYGAEPISMLREDIAAVAGTAKETLIRTLTDFREEKLIEVEDGRIVVLKPDKLRQLFN